MLPSRYSSRVVPSFCANSKRSELVAKLFAQADLPVSKSSSEKFPSESSNTNASPVYGDFATVIGLITWFGLHSAIALLGAELNHALPARRLTDLALDELQASTT